MYRPMPERIKLRSKLNGERYAFSGVGGAENEFSIPVTKFRVEDIVGTYLVQLAPCVCGKLKYLRSCRDCQLELYAERCEECQKKGGGGHQRMCDECKGPITYALSAAPVNALLNSRWEIRTHGTLADPSLPDNENMVIVSCGPDKLYEQWDEIPPGANIDVPTPPTPRSPSMSCSPRS